MTEPRTVYPVQYMHTGAERGIDPKVSNATAPVGIPLGSIPASSGDLVPADTEPPPEVPVTPTLDAEPPAPAQEVTPVELEVPTEETQMISTRRSSASPVRPPARGSSSRGRVEPPV